MDSLRVSKLESVRTREREGGRRRSPSSLSTPFPPEKKTLFLKILTILEKQEKNRERKYDEGRKEGSENEIERCFASAVGAREVLGGNLIGVERSQAKRERAGRKERMRLCYQTVPNYSVYLKFTPVLRIHYKSCLQTFFNLLSCAVFYPTLNIRLLASQPTNEYLSLSNVLSFMWHKILTMAMAKNHQWHKIHNCLSSPLG